ncbi:MAG TPA: signal recognition particle protein [Candidatus Sphingobacterium stercoripullorum]|uniref:Signal recognition particle protein n=1 Tax=Candidatus Sphingobacterium stercoripullorum TaxID=2838759 RepID=A0A9D2AXL0_9SPHI|nr:signal recognition particle protein [Candidatus Sphingobacterium stercoripullorum]HLR50834.1 signal recognition particle protein [Candidatus Sphingobacterium stercoripullorum]
MFQNLQDKLDRAFHVLKGQGSITEVNVAETMKEIRRALLDADVNYKTAKAFTDEVKEQALGQNVLTSISPGQLLTKIMNDELTELMGGEVVELDLTQPLTIILIAGLNGAGKTTFSGKLANYLKATKNKKPLLVAGDVYRPAAIDQLEVLAGQVGVPVYLDRESTDPVAIAAAGVEHAKKEGHNVVIIDTAGRLAIDEALMTEITAVKDATNPHEILFVVDSMTGQDAVNTAKAFNDRLDYSGVVLTKLDGDTRGGAALSIKSVVNKPIKFIGTGEKLDALDVFHPDRMASRILGMGDVVSLVERAQQQFDEKEAAELQKKIRKNKFDFNDFKSQIHQIKKMGNMKDLIGMIPGAGKMLKDVEIEDDAFTPIEAIIDSMTPFERANPDTIDQSRRHRIAKGSGTNITEVNKLLKQFKDMRKVMKQMSNPSKMARLMRNMPNMPGRP